MDTCKFLTATILVAALSIPTITNAALVGRLAATEGGTDYQAYYDTEADLTWLADANYAFTSGYINTITTAYDDGRMSWQQSNAWVAGLNIDGVDGWRLANTLQPDASCDGQAGRSYGYNCTGSEMGNLFYNVLGNSAGSLSNTSQFSNIQSNIYWSATEFATITTRAWNFYMGVGYQNFAVKEGYGFYGWAVQSGDVSAVPIPPSLFLFGSGLLGLLGFARRKANA